MNKQTKVVIHSDDPHEAEYIAKILINDAHDRKLSASCKKLFKGIFADYYKKEVKLKGGK
ncbi:MAG: hypothetical protein ACP5SB_06690 [Caldisericaceae bacterium]